METRGSFVTIKRIAQLFFLLGVFLKQFYLLPSGSFQIGDALFMVSFLTLVFLRDREQFLLDRRDYWLIAFVLCVVLINGIYIVIYGMEYDASFHYHTSILNYVYILLVVLTFRQFCEDRDFLKGLRWTLQAAILVQTVFCLLELTERYAGSRLVGSFNDPNQCGFFLMSAIFIIYLIAKMTGEGHPWLWSIPALYCIVETSSTGMMLGVAVFIGLAILIRITGRSTKSAIIFILVAGLGLGTGYMFASGKVQLPESVTSSLMYRRIIGKTESFGVADANSGSFNLDNFITDRSMGKIVKYPEYVLFGAGEGYYERLPAGDNIRQEIHSSLFGPIFYYGIFPCLMWLIWTGIQLKNIKRELWSVYLALILESITLVNNRQPFFWMIFVLAGSCLAKKDDPEEMTDRKDQAALPEMAVPEIG